MHFHRPNLTTEVQEVGTEEHRYKSSLTIFCDDPDTFIALAVQAGANGSFDSIKNHKAPWGIHRQGGFIDPFGHIWLVGDRSPLNPFP